MNKPQDKAGMRPEVYSYHDYLEFFRAWIEYKKGSQPRFSMRSLARLSGFAAGYLPMVLSGKRVLSSKAVQKLLPHLDLNLQERTYFESLVSLGTADSQELRIAALDRMRRSHSYRRENPRELEVHQYLSHWYYVVIREMSAMPSFVAEPEWIQQKLQYKVGLMEIRAALDFLIERHYIKKNDRGGYSPAEMQLNCVGGVYRVALTQFHEEMLELAGRSISSTPSDERNITCHTLALNREGFEQARDILNEALVKIQELELKLKESDSVYHIELALFPMTKRSK